MFVQRTDSPCVHHPIQHSQHISFEVSMKRRAFLSNGAAEPSFGKQRLERAGKSQWVSSFLQISPRMTPLRGAYLRVTEANAALGRAKCCFACSARQA